jgi:hypothetical protein
MIEKFAILRGKAASEFTDLDHTSNSLELMSLLIPKLAQGPWLRTQANFGIGTLERDDF